MLPEAGSKFEYNLFKEPDAFHRPVYMWCWNSPLRTDDLVEELRALKSEGAGGVMVVPEPSSFRPDTMKTYLRPDYLTKAYFEVYAAVAAEANRLGLKLWFYDEGGWPSGSACGKVTAKHPNLAVKRLVKTEKDVKKGNIVPTDALFSRLSAKNGKTDLAAGDIVPENGTLTTVSVEMPKSGLHPVYPDLLNKSAADAFIEIGCAPYLPYLGNFAGKTMPLLFTDEPTAANPPWSDGFKALFEQKKGYDITARLDELFETDEESAKTRIDYFDFWSEIFAESYFGTMRAWCEENGIAFAGHLSGDDRLEGLRKYGYAEPFRMFRKMDVPGVDAIWRQIFPGGRRGKALIFDIEGADAADNYHYPRWAASAARQAGRPWALSESFAVYGQGLNPAEMKWIVNYQLARGITLFCFSTLASGVSGPLMAGERPVFSRSDPLRQCLKPLNAYTARLSYLLSLGKPDVCVALYMPVRDVWSGTADSERVMARYDALAAELERKGVDFDVVDDDCLEAAEITGSTLKCGAAAYSAVVVPGCRYQSPAAAEKLRAFEATGGRVQNRTDGLHGTLKTQPEGLCLSVMRRILDGGSLYFISNEETESIRFRAVFPEKTRPLLLDPETGEVLAPDCEACTEGFSVMFSLPFAGSAALLFGDASGDIAAASGTVRFENVIEIDSGWTFERTKVFTVGENELENRRVSEKARSVSLGPWAAYARADFSGEGTYSVTFLCPEGAQNKKARLNLGRVEFACRCTLNGHDLGLRPWPPYAYDIGGFLKSGENRLRVTVINTAANQYVNTKVFNKWNGAELGCYHERALVFERESLGGGLFGKVTVEY